MITASDAAAVAMTSETATAAAAAAEAAATAAAAEAAATAAAAEAATAAAASGASTSEAVTAAVTFVEAPEAAAIASDKDGQCTFKALLDLIETAGNNFKVALDPIVNEVLGVRALQKGILPDEVHPSKKASYKLGNEIGQMLRGHVLGKQVFITGDSSLCSVYHDKKSGKLCRDYTGSRFHQGFCDAIRAKKKDVWIRPNWGKGLEAMVNSIEENYGYYIDTDSVFIVCCAGNDLDPKWRLSLKHYNDLFKKLNDLCGNRLIFLDAVPKQNRNSL